MQTRRSLLRASGAALCAGLAGCATTAPSGSETSPEIAVAAQWNVLRARTHDVFALEAADETDHRATLAGNLSARLSEGTGEWGTRTQLEETKPAACGTVTGTLQTLAGSEDGPVEDEAGIRERVDGVDRQFRQVQRAAVGERNAAALEASLLAVLSGDVGMLAETEAIEAAETVAWLLRGRFEDGPVAGEADDLGRALSELAEAADRADGEGIHQHAQSALERGVEASYALARDRAVADAAHLAALQSLGWDAATLASIGGPGEAMAHAAVLTGYRARLADAAWLAEHGETAAARTTVQDLFAEFESAAAHEAIEEADRESYEAFEEKLEASISALEGDGDPRPALGAADGHLLAGVEALVGARRAALLEAAYFRGRLDDALLRDRNDESAGAAAVVRDLFARFEANEGELHEVFEETDREAYEAFEEDLEASVTALEAGDGTGEDDDEDETGSADHDADGRAATDHLRRAREALFELTIHVGSSPAVATAEAAYATARVADAATVARVGTGDRATAILRETLARFEADTGGFHEALEHADHETYEAFEEELENVIETAENGGDVHDAALGFFEAAAAATRVVVGNGGGTDAAADTMSSVFERFETADVHDRLERRDSECYERFEGALATYAETLRDGGDVDGAASTFADASLRAQFAITGATDSAPVDPISLPDDESDYENLEGGPNVVESVPDDVDHVIDVLAASFDPEALTIESGETVAWVHTEGEPHTVTAYEAEIPGDAPYWASGGFDSEDAAREGWLDGKGALVPGTVFVRTFETPGRHGYFCVPHETAGHVGEIIVE